MRFIVSTHTKNAVYRELQRRSLDRNQRVSRSWKYEFWLAILHSFLPSFLFSVAVEKIESFSSRGEVSQRDLNLTVPRCPDQTEFRLTRLFLPGCSANKGSIIYAV